MAVVMFRTIGRSQVAVELTNCTSGFVLVLGALPCSGGEKTPQRSEANGLSGRKKLLFEGCSFCSGVAGIERPALNLMVKMLQDCVACGDHH